MASIVGEETLQQIHQAAIESMGKDGNLFEQLKLVTPIHEACFKGNLDMVKYLANNNCDLNVRDPNGITPVNLACLRGHENIVCFLVTLNNCELHLGDNQGNTPVHNAAAKHCKR